MHCNHSVQLSMTTTRTEVIQVAEQRKPNATFAVALAMQTEDLSAFELINMGLAERREDAQDLALRSYMRRYSDLLQTQVWGSERDLPDWTDNVHQPYAPCKVTRADGTSYVANPKASDLRLARVERAKSRKTGVLEGAPERPRQVGNLFVLSRDEASDLGSMAWLASE